jgi:signal transduction histidine kinase
MLRRIESATERLGALIDELLTVTQFEAGALEPLPHNVLVADVLNNVRSRALEPELVTVRCPDDLRLIVDDRLLTHAVGLLVDNALKYAGDAELHAGIDDRGNTYVEVRDHGPGIPPELGDRVFERFARGDHTEPGMGLGLPLVRTLAIGLDADVSLRDAKGGGAAFRLTFA